MLEERDNVITLLEGMMYVRDGEDPSKAIENQERRGQQSVVRNQRLPKKSNDHSVPYEIRSKGTKKSMDWDEKFKIEAQNNIEYTKQQYEKMGIVVVEEYDDLFWNVELPDGWKIEATGHTMWNNLYDNKGRKRANFFYKAAFYDRDAFINFDTRFHIAVNHVADISSDYETWEKSDYQGTVEDGEEVVFSTECVSPTDDYWKNSKIQSKLLKQLEKYMDEHYPDYKDIHAYWE